MLVPAILVYTLTGILQPVLVDILRYHGADGGKLLLPMLANTLGMMLTIFLSSSSSAKSSPATPSGVVSQWRGKWKTLAHVTLVDMMSGASIMTGLLFVGSGTYVVIYSSCTIFSALLARRLLRRHLSRMRWLAVVCITVGVAASGYINASLKANATEVSSSADIADHLHVLFGICILLAGAASR
jgi:drug/metabolite transporter (DMT)-like permease